ncbi:MAG: hypothetical protein OXF63_03445 [Anaerolineaceae bacterium]|nr:hypothetical protein [Anaerolineaceae bacterium]
MREYVSNISPGNKALEFIDFRLADDQYRGAKSSQHNRYTMDEARKILTLLHKYAPDKSLMHIRTTDSSKRPKNLPEEATYARFCDEVKATLGKGTQDAMRKNLFPDFHRMGLIVRYGGQKIPTNPLCSQPVKYVSLSDQGLRFIQADAIDEQFYIFSSGVDRLLGGFISVLLRLLRDQDYNLKRIDIHEFLFFVSAIGTQSTFSIHFDRCVELLKSYRNLSRIQRIGVIDTLSQELKPANYDGPKPSQRDFHNWHNKATQIFYILAQTVYFEVRDEVLRLRQGKMRSYGEKHQYFKRHRVERTFGFELHHVVPLAWSESEGQFKLFDNWLNMVYINAYEHAIITQKRNRNVRMTASEDDLILSDYSDNSVYLKNTESILYATEHQPDMLDYNRRLLEIV